MPHQIQRHTAPSEAPAWGQADGYRAARPGRHRGDRHSPTTQTANSPPQVAAKAATLDAQIRQTENLQITTDDGDKVSISLATLKQLHAESFQGQAGGASIDYGSASSSNKVSVGIQVDGSLDDKELADIGKLLGQLAASVHDSSQSPSALQLQDGGSLASLSSFQFAYQEQIRASYSGA
jgi:hypothetical protein